jgi:hypothetical protein
MDPSWDLLRLQFGLVSRCLQDRELVCSSEADPEVPLSRAALSPLEAQKMRIYCFGWTVRRPQEDGFDEKHIEKYRKI